MQLPGPPQSPLVKLLVLRRVKPQICSSSGLQEQILMSVDIQCLKNWLIANKVTLNMMKTKFILVGSRQRIATMTVNMQAFVNINFFEPRVYCTGIHAVNACGGTGTVPFISGMFVMSCATIPRIEFKIKSCVLHGRANFK